MGFWRNNRPYGQRRPKGPPLRLRPPPTPRRERIDPTLHNINRTKRYITQQYMTSTKLKIDFQLICIIKRLPADSICGSRRPTTWGYTTHLFNRECHRRGFYSYQGPLQHRPRLPSYSPIVHDIYRDLLDRPLNEPTSEISSYSHPEFFLKIALLLLLSLSSLAWCTCHPYELSQLYLILSRQISTLPTNYLFQRLSVGYLAFCNLPLLFHTTNLPPIIHLAQLTHHFQSFTTTLSTSIYYHPDFLPLYRCLVIGGVLYSGITFILYTLFKRHTFPHRYKVINNSIHVIYQRGHYHPRNSRLQPTSNTIKHNTNFSLRRFLLLYVYVIICLRIPLNIMSTNNNNSAAQPPNQNDQLAAILNAVTGVRTDIDRLSSRIEVLESPPRTNNSTTATGVSAPAPNHQQQALQPDNVWDQATATAPISPLGASTTHGSSSNNAAPSIPSPPASIIDNTDTFTTVQRRRNKNNAGRIGGRGGRGGRASRGGRNQGYTSTSTRQPTTTPLPARQPLSTLSSIRHITINWWTQKQKLQDAGGDVEDTSPSRLGEVFLQSYKLFDPSGDGIITHVHEDKMRGAGGSTTIFSGYFFVESTKSTVEDDDMIDLLENWQRFVNSKSHWTLTNDANIPKIITVYRFGFPPTNFHKFSVVGACAQLPGNYTQQSDVIGNLYAMHSIIQEVEDTLETPSAILQSLCSHPWKTYQHLGIKTQPTDLKNNREDILVLNIVVSHTEQAQPVANAFFDAATDPVTQTCKSIHVLGGLRAKFSRCPKDRAELRAFYNTIEKGVFATTVDHYVIQFVVNSSAYDSDSDIVTNIIAKTPDCIAAFLTARATRSRPSLSLILEGGSNTVCKGDDYFRDFAYKNVSGSAPAENVPPPARAAPVIDPLQDMQSQRTNKKKRKDADWASLNEFADQTRAWNAVLNGRGGIYSTGVSKWQSQFGAKYLVNNIPYNRHQGDFTSFEGAYAFVSSHWDPLIFDQPSLDNLLRRFVPLDFTNLDVIWFPKLNTPSTRQDKRAYTFVEENRPDLNVTRAKCTPHDPTFDINIAATIFAKYGRPNSFTDYLRSRKYDPSSAPCRSLPPPPGIPPRDINIPPNGTSPFEANANDNSLPRDDMSELSQRINNARMDDDDASEEIVPATQLEEDTTNDNIASKRTADDRSQTGAHSPILDSATKKIRAADTNGDGPNMCVDVDDEDFNNDDGSSRSGSPTLLPDDDNYQLEYGASQNQESVHKSLVISAPAFTTVHDAEEFIAQIFAKGGRLPNASSAVQVTLCSYRQWPHAVLVVGTLLDISFVEAALCDLLILGQIFDHDFLLESDNQFITHVPSNATAEAHAKVSSVQYCKNNCPDEKFEELATLISSAVHAHQIFDMFSTWGQGPKGTGAAKLP